MNRNRAEIPGQRRPIQFFPNLLGVMGQVDHSGFQPGKTHVQRCAVYVGVGQLVDASRRLLCQVIHRLSPRIGQPQYPGRLVEALPCRVVPRAP